MRWPGFRKVRRQVCKRINRRLHQLELDDLSAYRDYLDHHPSEWSQLDSMCRISISKFYRDRGVFDLLRDELLPQLAGAVTGRGERVLRVWSAGCASGEEVYTLKIVWELAVQSRFPTVELQITATDADPHLLDRAHRGCYAASSLKDFPAAWITTAFDAAGDEYWVRDRFRQGLDFQLQDIRQRQPKGPFDLILCRHLVLTYFETALQVQILRQMVARLHRQGIFVTGKQEPLPTAVKGLEQVHPHSGIYRRTRARVIR
jgi:chemotaxis protein methyltransferase CheR